MPLLFISRFAAIYRARHQIANVDAMFNRMIIYPSNILHSGNIAADFNFDQNPATGRLTLNSFIYGKQRL